ncbi:MAG: hypothetical protein NT033_00140 [Candidatus Omnitrophica bacterium]|nr:hypothetical protein [Candidatus Omnitrophota bacterium]
MRVVSLTSFMTGLALLSCAIFCHAQGTDVISKKTTSLLCSLLNSNDPAKFSQDHNIELKDGMVKVIMIIDARLLPKDFESKYGLKEFHSLRKNMASACIKPDSLRKICEEPGVIFVRLPIKLRALSK